MATEKTDVVIVGVGAAGGIIAAELAKAGMKVIGLERGPRLKTADFEPHDELRYFQRQDLRPNLKTDAGHLAAERQCARHIRCRSLNNGNQAGGGTVHYGALSWRMHEDDFRVRTQDDRALRRVGHSAGFLADRLAAELRRARAVLRPGRVRAWRVGQGRQPAGQEDRRRQRLRGAAQARISAAAAAWSISRRSCSRLAPRSSAFTRSRRRARSCRSPTTTGRAAPIAASARRSAATSAPNRRSWSPNCRRPTPPAISSSSPAPCAIASTATIPAK